MTADNEQYSKLTTSLDKKSKICIYDQLEQMGMPSAWTLIGYRGNGLINQAHYWLKDNWMNNMYLTRYIVKIVSDYREFGKLNMKAKSHSKQLALRGVVQFIKENHVQLEHLIAVYFPSTTLGGLPLPKISTAFNDMTYEERQKILRDNNSAKIELVKGN